MPKVYEALAVTSRIKAMAKDTCLAETALPGSLEVPMNVLITLGMLDVPGPRVTFAIDPESPGTLRVFIWDVSKVPECLSEWNTTATVHGSQHAQAWIPMEYTFQSMATFIHSFAKLVVEPAVV